MSKNAFIIDAVRTPIGNFGGTLSTIRPDDMAAHVIKELIARNQEIDLAKIEDVIFGCANQAGEDNRNVARMAALLAGVPITAGAETINRLCSSGMAAVINAARAIKDDAGDLYIAGGVESMTRAPWVISKSPLLSEETPKCMIPPSDGASSTPDYKNFMEQTAWGKPQKI